MTTINSTEVYNQLYIQFERKDTEFNELYNQVIKSIEDISNEELSIQFRYKKIVSIEFILFKMRCLVDSEHINVKQVLSDKSVSETIKAPFVKRDVHLAQVNAKLTTLQADIANIQKLVYTYQNI